VQEEERKYLKMSGNPAKSNGRPPQAEACRRLAREMNIPCEISALLVQKGITDEKEAGAFLYPRLADLPSPFMMKGMEQAVDLVLETCRRQGFILIHGDYDVDGISGTALLSLFFSTLGIATTSFQPNRMRDGYGLQKRIIEEHRPPDNSPALLITVDCGISSHEEIRLARESGYAVLVTDHHEPPEVLPEADAILNPRQPGCMFPCRELAGVGVAFFLAMAIRSRMVRQGMTERQKAPVLKDLLSLVALGTVADVMPLTGINRILVRAGLEVISSRSVPWTWALCDRAGLKEGAVSAEDISFRLAPRINAPGRLGEPGSAFRLLTSPDTVTALELAGELESINLERRRLETDSIDEIERQCREQVKTGCRGLVVHGSYHPGIIGVMASRIVEKFGRPVLIFTDDVSGPAVLKGSGRSVDAVNLYTVLHSCSEMLLQFGGHAMAAGMTLEKKNFARFAEAFNDAITRLSIADGEPVSAAHDYVEAQGHFFDKRFVRYYELLEPFGNGNPEPVFLLPNQRIARPAVVNSHLKYRVRINGQSFRGIGFNLGDRLELVQSAPVDLLFKLRKNTYRGREYIELHTVDITAARNS
jgi:single-stranded-DNA-specific exonuclease